MLRFIRNLGLAVMMVLPVWAQANTVETPYTVVKNTTDALLADLKVNKENYKQNPQLFYQAMNNILAPVVDVEGISRSVMTVRFANQASPEQMARFQENFKQGLMQFYGNALLEYNNQSIRILPEARQRNPKRAEVQMEVTDTNGTVYPMSYTMELKNGHWQVRNVIINGINIGKLFRDQFAEAMQKNRNNLDLVINDWANIVGKAKEGNSK
ncbi:ABC transporter substrate-binding protein [Pseudomonas sp. F1_0610]|uniref:MlaC/ttg2D family ABC transporter substrate-binding protein n=1 Tax=Pseudomonas sp. F1_0610 TaxID=3114284 RepID=UPI0039C0C7F4